jgi:hypothetical protein
MALVGADGLINAHPFLAGVLGALIAVITGKLNSLI